MPARNDSKALALCLFQSLAGVIFGWSNSEGSGLFNMDSYNARFGEPTGSGNVIGTTRQSVITGMLSVGAVIGAVGSGSVASKFGLRKTCMASIFLYLIGAAIETSAMTTYGQICVARVLTGLGVGCTSGLVPVFQAEAAPPRFRGLVTGSFQLCVTLGIFGVSLTSWQMAEHHTGDITWRIPVSLQMVWAFLLLIGFLFSPESPRFLASKGDWEGCRKNLAILRSVPVEEPEIEVEMEEIRAAVIKDQERGEAHYAECFSTKDRILWRTMIGVFVQIGQQITGINFFFNYGVQFAQTAGLDNSYIFQVILASVNVVMSIPGIIAVDRFGRRPVLIWGAAIMLAGQVITGAVSIAKPDDTTSGKVLISMCCVFVASFAASWGPVAWVVCGETFPMRLSNLCVTLGTGANWLFNLIIAFAAPQIQARIGTSITFVWAGCLLLNLIFTFFCIPETKGMSIEEVDALYLSRCPAWQSGNFRKAQLGLESATAEKRTRGFRDEQVEEVPKSSRFTSARTSARTSVERTSGET